MGLKGPAPAITAFGAEGQQDVGTEAATCNIRNGPGRYSTLLFQRSWIIPLRQVTQIDRKRARFGMSGHTCRSRAKIDRVRAKLGRFRANVVRDWPIST